MFLRPVEGRRAFEEILHQLEEAIAAGHLVAGDRLPPERELASHFRVSRTSVREALRVLEALGIVRVRRGADNGATILEEPGNALNHLLRFHLALHHVSIRSLVEFRVVIETWAAATLASLGPAEALAELDAIVSRMEEEDPDPVAFHELDTAFHLAMVRACGNELATLVIDGSRTAIQRTMLEVLLDMHDWPRSRDRLVAEHRAIQGLIAAGEGEQASQLVQRHITAVYDDFLARHPGVR